ncbi:MAG TPA: hypothetical protein DIV80_07235 [Synergistaceae bacterium]|jgi:hypothetical protein|nr:hypothetical protein [Synergistaceae bacterium]HCR39228.1 hypothetical protein [Synergistaceae bacterium]
MLYFQFLSLVFGIVMVSLAPAIAIRGERWIDLFNEVFFPEKQPVWLWVAGGASAFLVLITWYVELTSSVRLSWVMTLFITLSLVKSYFLIFRYEQSRRTIMGMMEKGRSFTVGLAGIMYLAGFCILCLGIFAF